ncbi:MAG: hypothetical protein LBI18_08630 [Planctomycetaceae bacterium]|jgi:hypothetical protein|nr:hypothetical protein [Planctomycetaceae bacterium]
MNRRQFNKTISVFSLFGLSAFSGQAKENVDVKQLNGELFQVAAQKRSGQAWINYPTRTIGHLANYKPKQNRLLGHFAGIPNAKTEKTGFWHVEKYGNRFWLVDPEGFLNIHRAVNSVTVGHGEHQKKVFAEKFKTKTNWSDVTIQFLKNNGFNGMGAWSDLRAFRQSALQKESPMAYTLNLALMGEYGKKRTVQVPGHRSYPNNGIFVFEPEFETFCDQFVAKKVADFKDDPNLLGYFTDNELPFKMNTLEGYLKLENPNDAGRQAAETWLTKRHKTIEQIKDQDRWEFLGYLGDKYSSITAKAIRKHDPNHLILGPRLYSDNRIRATLMKAIAQYIDIISFNYYGVWTPLEEQTKGWTEWTGKPFMVTEWYTKGEDSGLPNTTGAGWTVRTQKDRGLFYQNYTLALLESQNCVGWHWFKYQDNDPTAKNPEASNIDSNKGIVNNNYEPYTDLLSQMSEINKQVFDLIEYFDSQKQS